MIKDHERRCVVARATGAKPLLSAREGGEAKTHRTSKQELDKVRALIARDMADASLPGLSADPAIKVENHFPLTMLGLASYRVPLQLVRPRHAVALVILPGRATRNPSISGNKIHIIANICVL